MNLQPQQNIEPKKAPALSMDERPFPFISVVTETFYPEVNGVAHTLKKITTCLSQQCRIQLIRPRQSQETSDLNNSDIQQVLVKGCPIPGYKELRFGLPCQKQIEAIWSKKKPNGIYVATEGPLGWSAIRAARALNLTVVSGFSYQLPCIQ